MASEISGRLRLKALRASILLAAVLVAACAEAPRAPEPVAQPPAAAPTAPERVEPAAAASAERIVSQPLKHLRGRNLKALPETALEVKTRCNFKDVAGGRGKMDLHVTKAEVKRFVVEIDIPKQGLCQFDMKTFTQTARLPNVVLTDAASGCVVNMWEQGREVTVAFNACAKACTGDAFSYLWPVLVDRKSGRCS